MTSKTKIQMDLLTSDYELLQSWAMEDGITIESLLRQMIEYTKFMREVEANGKQKLLVLEGDRFELVTFR